MNLQPKLQKLANKINGVQDLHLQVSDEANSEENIGFLILLLSLVGGLFANAFFLAFLVLIGFFNNATAVLILSLILLAIGLVFSKLNTSMVLQTILSTLVISGTALFIYALNNFGLDFKFCCLILSGLCIGFYFLFDDFIIRFLSVITFLNSFLYSLVLIIFKENSSEFAIMFGKFYLLIVLFGVFWILKNEEKWFANKTLNKLFQPTLSGMQLFVMLFMYVKMDNNTFGISNMIHHLILSGLFLYVLYDVLNTILNAPTKIKLGILIPFTIFIFTSIYQPSMLISMLLILLYFKHKEMIFLYFSILSLLVSIGLFYYDLSINLFNKSLLLMGGGLLFFIIYLVSKKLNVYEK